MMRTQMVLIAALVALAPAAIAQKTVIQDVRGKGIAKAESTPPAEFTMQVTKHIVRTDSREIVRVEGSFQFGMADPERGLAVHIQMPKARELAVVIAEVKEGAFAGPGVMTVRNRRGVRRIEGAVRVRVVDAADPASAGPVPDKIAVHFVPRTGADPFQYEGPVVRGDVRIAQREIGR